MKPLSRDLFIKGLLAEDAFTLPEGTLADELSVDEFNRIYPIFFEAVLSTAKADISGISGYGEFDENNRPSDSSCEAFLRNTFSEEEEGYWYHWREMFACTMLTEDFFNEIFSRMMRYAPFCEHHRYLVNGFTFFGSMVTDGRRVAFVDWSRSGVMDFMIDFAIMDVHKPYLLIPEKLWDYARRKGIVLTDFRERYLCMAYFVGINTLRWHASIDDEESCRSIIRYLNELEDRIMKIGEAQ